MTPARSGGRRGSMRFHPASLLALVAIGTTALVACGDDTTTGTGGTGATGDATGSGGDDGSGTGGGDDGGGTAATTTTTTAAAGTGGGSPVEDPLEHGALA